MRTHNAFFSLRQRICVVAPTKPDPVQARPSAIRINPACAQQLLEETRARPAIQENFSQARSYGDRAVILLDDELLALPHLGQHRMDIAGQFGFTNADRSHTLQHSLTPHAYNLKTVAAPELSPQFPWYALKVRARGEAQIRTALERKSYETLLPTYKEPRQYSDRVKTIDAPLFPGYLFCRMDVTRRLPVLTTPGVDYILSINGEPDPLPEHEIAAIERLVHSGANARPWPFLKSGNRVRVERGSFSGVEGILVSERGSDRLILSISMLERSVSLDIDRTWIRPLD